MNRRQMITLSGAVAATQGMAAAASTQNSAKITKHASKVLVKYIRARSSYKIPKSEAKTAKYLNSATALLALSSAQQQQAATIFNSAVPGSASVRASLKNARKNLKDAVRNNDNAAISQVSATMGSLRAQLTAIGAAANAAFYQILNTDQQAKLTQFKKHQQA